MNLSLLRSTFLIVAGACALTACGAGDVHGTDAALDDAAFPPASDVSSTPCGSNGTSVIHVRFSASSDAVRTAGGLWLGAICTDGAGTEHSTRVVVVDPSDTDLMLTALGPGQYVVRASAPTFQGVSSPNVQVASSVDVTTAIYLPLGLPLLAQVHAALGGDGGVPSVSDAGVVTRTFSGSAIRTSGSATTLATVETSLLPRDATSFDVITRVTAAGDCAADCRPITITGVELRLASNGQPVALAEAPFGSGSLALAPNHTGVSDSRTLPGSLGDAQLTLDVLLFGSVGGDDADAGTASDAGRDR